MRTELVLKIVRTPLVTLVACLLTSIGSGCGPRPEAPVRAAPSPLIPGEDAPESTIPAEAAPQRPPPVFPMLAALRIDAWLYAAPDEKAQRYRARRLPFPVAVPGGQSPDPWTRTRAVRVMAQDGPWLTIETGPVDACNQNLFDRLAVRFYVHADALVPVTARALALTDPDGTELDLPSGAPADGAPPAFAVGSWLVRATLPADAIGTMYQADPVHLADRRLDEDSFRVDAHVQPRVRGDVAWARHGTEPPAGMPAGNVIIPIAVIQRGAKDTLIEAADSCGRMRALIPAANIQANDSEDGGEEGAPFGFGRIAKFQFRAGAPLSWPDGTPAGSVIEAVAVDPYPLSGGRTCASFELETQAFRLARPAASQLADDFSLCVATGDLVRL